MCRNSGFDGGLRFNYGSYTDAVGPDLTGKLRSYTAFFGRTWYAGPVPVHFAESVIFASQFSTALT
jgi:hypothetical protein